MEAILSNDRLKISPRALALAIQNNVNVHEITPTGPEGRIIENDILRAIEERNRPKVDPIPEPEATPVEEPTATASSHEVTAEIPTYREEPEEAKTEDTVEEKAEIVEETAEVVEEKAEIVEETAEVVEEKAEAVEETAEATEEKAETVEETVEATEEKAEAVEETVEATEEKAEAVEETAEATEEKAEAVEETAEATEEKAEAVEETAEATEEKAETVEEKVETTEEKAETVEPVTEAPAEAKSEETAIMAAPITAPVAAEEEKEESKAKTEPDEKTFKAEEVYRHTDVIIPQSETAPDATPITLEMSFDATAILTLRNKIKENGELMNLPSITLNDMILFATAKTLKKHKALNAHFLGDKIRYFDGIHLGIAVDTERGPQTLTVFDTDRLSLSSLSKITGALIRGARAGNDSPEKNQRMGSFTVTNVGTLGVERFTPTLTAPQTGVLGVCALTSRVKSVDGEDVIYPCIPLSLTFDPRAMSTANAAKFLRDLCTALENFGLLLIK